MHTQTYTRTTSKLPSAPTNTLTYIVIQGTHLHTQYTHNLIYTHTTCGHSHDYTPHTRTHLDTQRVHNCHIYPHTYKLTVTHTYLHTVTHTLTASYKDGPCILHPPLPKLTTGHAHQSKLLIHVLIYSSQYLLMTVSSMNLYHLLFMLIPLFIILGISGTHGDVSAEGSRSVVCLGPACVPQCLLSSQHRCPVNTGEGMQGPEMVGRPADQT